jgi:hypothetical protein
MRCPSERNPGCPVGRLGRVSAGTKSCPYEAKVRMNLDFNYYSNGVYRHNILTCMCLFVNTPSCFLFSFSAGHVTGHPTACCCSCSSPSPHHLLLCRVHLQPLSLPCERCWREETQMKWTPLRGLLEGGRRWLRRGATPLGCRVPRLSCLERTRPPRQCLFVRPSDPP